MEKAFVTITGPSLSGKTTLVRKLLDTGYFHEVVSHTTRPMRSGEVDGKDYFFVSEDTFSRTRLIESVSLGGFRYGIAAETVENALESGVTPIVIVDPAGVEQVAKWVECKPYRHLRIFVDINRQVQYERFIQRILTDKNFSQEVYRARFEMMREESLWMAMSNWDLVVRNDLNTQQYFINTILWYLGHGD